MPRIHVKLDLPDSLLAELEMAARQCELSTPAFVSEVLTADLAARRLPGVPSGHTGPRVLGDDRAGAAVEHSVFGPAKNIVLEDIT